MRTWISIVLCLYTGKVFSVNQNTEGQLKHQYAEMTACKAKSDAIECETLSIKSSEYEDMTSYEFIECPAYI